MNLIRLPLLLCCVLFVASCSMGGDDGSELTVPTEEPTSAQWSYPQSRSLGSHRIVVHAPQIRAWPDFVSMEALLAVEFYPDSRKDTPLYATVSVTGATELQLQQRQVIIGKPQVDSVVFTAGGTDDYVSALQDSVRNDRLVMPLDLFLAYLEEDVLDTAPGSGPSAGFNVEAPEILIAHSPSILLYVPEQPYLQALEKTRVEIAINANWPLLFDPAGERWYLLYRDLWLSAKDLAQHWDEVDQLPSRLATLSPQGAHAALLAAIPPLPTATLIPTVIYRSTPAELVVIDGEPVLESIADSADFAFVSNTDVPLLRYKSNWYFLAAGRWFASSALDDTADWQFQTSLPPEFASIPRQHSLGWLRASIPDTPEARMASLEASLPQQREAVVGGSPGIAVVYDGEPDFQAIADTAVARAANSANEVLLVVGVYYLLYEGVWYRAEDPHGPWLATADVPQAIYNIPPESPSYAATDVKVSGSSADTVTYSHTGVYSSGTYVSSGVTVYSTGWYYPPYMGAFYYPYYPAYGGGRYYNPNTGAYGARSVWYGPYGGYSYGEGYNPSTGRYGYRETAWDGDDWESYSEVYNENRDTKTKTERSYDDDDGKFKMERKTSGDNGGWVETDRTTNVEDGWQKTTRESSRGGSMEMNREWDDSGTLTSAGTIETADGRSATITGSYQDGDGSTTIKGSEGGEGTVDRSRRGDTVTRQGDFTNAEGDTLSSSSKRSGRDSITELESSTGGQLKSVSDGGQRTTLGQSASGDLYAGHNGDVYKKTDDGWQQYDRGNSQWQSSENTRANRNAQRAQLERDAAARNRGEQRFQQRRGRGRGRRR
jgi:hypothetical protein